MCFSFAAKTAVDTNQLKELRESLRAGNEDSSMALFVSSESREENKLKIKNNISKK